MPNAYKTGGIPCLDEETLSKLRGITKDIISQIGKKIFSLDFNLTTVTFPIKFMKKNSIL